MEVVPGLEDPLVLYCDNSGAMVNSKEHRSHKKGKHIEIKCHLVREIVQIAVVSILKIASEHNLADPFTKMLPAKQFEDHVQNLGLREMSHLL